jgi:tubulin--tyrosine ligase
MRVLLVNDDGPPSTISPHVLGLWETLQSELGWQVSVVLPSFQKSWGGMAMTISTPVSVWYYYPLRGNYDGKMPKTDSSWSAARRPIAEDEVGEWILLDGVSLSVLSSRGVME